MGALHWIGYINNREVMCQNNREVISAVIVSFDVSNERFVDFLFPEEVQIPDQVLWLHQCVAGVLGNCLCLSNYYNSKRIDIWIMQDYGVRESWSKRYSFRTTDVLVFEDWKLLWSFTNGELLIDTGVSKLVHDPKSDRSRVLKIDGIDDSEMEFSVPLNYVESLISPDTVGIKY
ncbi:F-box/kelch-repeat protein At3g06240-like [Papaver somniferum]|uniref:F-box/kelch-repeat protein At3g06240-like n=1 Tax=Papaver somniferum TaxID=3469 RepID=UPI000E703521|nr:F-box/kelch-repeat protein At3g06240-like [Papaver somniferum]